MEDLTNKYLLIQKAKENGVTVSDDEVLAVITSIPSFQVDGQFNKEAYQTILARSRMTPQQFEESVRTDRLAEKMRELITSSVAVSDEEVAKEYTYRNKKASVSYITLDAENFSHEVKAEEAVLKEYFSANAENYRIPKRSKSFTLTLIPQLSHPLRLSPIRMPKATMCAIRISSTPLKPCTQGTY
ncbi:MAG: SurA N-terminal domain-containing protein [Geovibrio sp.]|nr:SurA N-terminal domain-containing protein [Geovibrio sp.]